MTRNIKNDVKVRQNLGLENELFADVYFYYAEEVARARFEVDKKDSHLKFILAEVAQEIRNSGERVTNDAVRERCEINTRVKKATYDLNVAKENRYYADAALDALEKKKKNLDNLTQLAIHNFYAGNVGQETMQNADRLSHAQSVESYEEKKASYKPTVGGKE